MKRILTSTYAGVGTGCDGISNSRPKLLSTLIISECLHISLVLTSCVKWKTPQEKLTMKQAFEQLANHSL